MRIYKTVTDHMNGRIADPTSSTGYKRRTGSERVKLDPEARRAKDRYRIEPIFEEAPAPKTYLYGSLREDGEIARGGTVHHVIEGCEAIHPFTAEEVEHVLQRLIRTYESRLFVLNGNHHQGLSDLTPADAFREAVEAHKRVLVLTGIDLDDTNAAFPFRLHQPNRIAPMESEEVTQTPAVSSLY